MRKGIERRDKMADRKSMARKPVPKIQTYVKYGFAIVEHDIYICPECKKVLNAGPNHQPKYCGQCGQRVTFDGVEWREDRQKGYILPGQEAGKYESIKDRVV